ncbi:hypothetical protein HDU87_002182 [Geranomyces variabilis]|uniref:Uncharacterized protein n=1 Tax=Geranomyces variabilis TaxID=109894 RepID=A0AAD5TP07_9FUNG|nr:hypothetical protein HDU87_002182 [Geranomyces variabilis]
MADQQPKSSGEPEKAKGKRPAQFSTQKDRKKARQHIHVREAPSSSSHEKKEPQPPALEGIPGSAPIKKPAGAVVSMLQAISVVEFAEARAFEIRAMEKALENSTEKSGVARVFQTVPRHMRRRAASHNIKRLPKRLHARAQAQMDNDPKQGRSKGQSSNRAEPKRKKQRKHDGAHGGSRWMETHLWNAKRMKIVDLWGWKIPEQPNDKNFRAAYRAAKTHCLLHDVSYFQVVELEGSIEALNTLLLAITDPTLPAVASARYISGTRQGSMHVHAHMQYPSAAIGPATFLWKPAEAGMSTRTLWIWLHPAIHKLVWDELQAGVKAASGQDVNLAISIKDLKEELVRFEITGPRSNAILHHIMQLCDEGESSGALYSASHKLWREIEDVHTPAALPPGAVIGLNVVDPRISFPPRMPPRNLPSASAEQAIETILNEWPSGVAQSAIWNADTRQFCLDTRQSEGALNKRRSEALVPGTPLDALPQDVRIPVLLLQRNCRAHVSDAASRKESREYAAGWDLVAPKGWATALLRSLVYAGARIGGLRERYMFHFEASLPCFPYDYPETTAQEAYASMTGAELEAKWKRMPPAKRANYAKMGIERPFTSPFENLANPAATSKSSEKANDAMDVDQAPVASKSNEKAVDAMDVDEAAPSSQAAGAEVDEPPAEAPPVAPSLPINRVRPVTVVTSPRLVTFLRTALATTPLGALPNALLSYWRNLIEARFAPEQLPNLNFGVISSLLVRVRIDMLRKGTPNDRARVYAATREEYDFWVCAIAKKDKDWGVDESRNRLDESPDPASLLGYVTTGSFSAAQGHGMAIACCRLDGLHRVAQEGISSGRKYTRFVLVRDLTGRVLLPATFQLIS